MNQPVPDVSEDDVRRIAARYFGEAKLPQVLSVLDEFGKQEWNEPANPRVRLAILKLADGDLEALSKHTAVAIQDFRDVLAWAEYPKWSKEIGFDKVPRRVEQKAIKADWQQYCEWLGREAEQSNAG